MSQYEKLLAKAKHNPTGLQIWYSPEGSRLSIQTKNGMAKGYQVRQFLGFIKEEADEYKR